MSLVAVAPLHVMFAQDINRYSLWVATILAASVLLIRATKKATKLRWFFYAVCSALSLYANVASALVLLGHAVFVHLTQESTRTVRRKFYLATASAVVMFIPWLTQMWFHRDVIQRANGELITRVPWETIIWGLLTNARLVFVDTFSFSPISVWLVLMVILPLEVFALWWLCQRNRSRAGMYVISMVAANMLLVLLEDLIFGGDKTTNRRYSFPWVIGLEVAMAGALGAHVLGAPGKKKLMAQLAFVLLIVAGVLSDFTSVQSTIRCSKGKQEATVARMMNAQSNSLWVGLSGPRAVEAVTISQLLRADARLVMGDVGSLREMAGGYRRVLIYSIKPGIRAEISNQLPGVKPLEQVEGYFVWDAPPDKGRGSAPCPMGMPTP
jgi:uncharacterized membrane protein